MNISSSFTDAEGCVYGIMGMWRDLVHFQEGTSSSQARLHNTLGNHNGIHRP